VILVPYDIDMGVTYEREPADGWQYGGGWSSSRWTDCDEVRAIPRYFVDIAGAYEDEFVQQGTDENRSIGDTLQVAWDLIGTLPRERLNRIEPETLDEHYEEREG